MLDEASQELFSTKSHQPLLVAASVIFPAKGDLVTVMSDQPMVANGNAMSVAAEITEDSLRAAEGGLSVGHPVLAAECLHERGKHLWCGQGVCAAEVEFLLPESAAKSSDELAPADPTKNFDREEESILRVNPVLVIRCEPARGNHAVNMWMQK
jgi:hypothetical protein